MDKKTKTAGIAAQRSGKVEKPEVNISKGSRNIDGMSDEEFAVYIGSIEGGGEPPKPMEESEAVGGDAEPENEPYERSYKNSADMRLFDRIRRIAMEMYSTKNPDEALFKMLTEIIKSQNARGKGAQSPTAETEQTDAEAKRQRILEERSKKWQLSMMQQSNQIKQRYPDFDFERLMQNPVFRNEVFSSGNIALALLRMNDDMQDIKKPRKRISENGMTAGSAAGAVRRNPSDMSDAEFKQYIERLSAGSRI